MKIIGTVLLVAALASANSLQDDEVITNTTQIVIGPGGEIYHLATIPSENKEEVEITDEDGNHITTVHNFINEGYIVENPTHRDVCFIRQSSDGNSTCFVENPVKNALPSSLQDICQGRERVTLKPFACDHPALDAAVPQADKRSIMVTHCVYDRHVNTVCSSKYCCKKFIWCWKHCCKYTVKVSWTRRCITGHSSAF
ncbi:uncharacterized protein LOC128245481 [Mya arenaria]|nr:uncharacterized protein LOC128245481 [Mya arenaria]